jgi:CBS domain containing-hemolysin-like protein
MSALLVVAAVVLLGAACVAVAVWSASLVAAPERLEAQAAGGVSGAAAGLRAARDPGGATALVQVLVPLAGTFAGWAAVVLIRRSGYDISVWWTVLAFIPVVVVTMLMVEMVPRSAALSSPERVLSVLGWPQRVLSTALGPFVNLCGWLAGALLVPVGMWLDGGAGRAHSAEELAALLGGAGAVRATGGSRDLFAGALGFLQVRVGDVMAPATDIVTVPHTSTVREAEALVRRSGHSRVLVVGAGGEVTGFLHAKDLIALDPEQRSGLLPAGLVRVALRVEPDDRLEDVLPRMRRARRHVAVVTRGVEVLGLVTLEDVLEAIVGDIHDESDRGGPAGGVPGAGSEETA